MWRKQGWMMLACGGLALGGIAYIGAYHVITAEWPWQRQRNIANMILRQPPPQQGASSLQNVVTAATGAPAAAQGTVREGALPSAILGETMPFQVYTPPDYDNPANAQRRYPVMYLLHGAPGTYQDWVKAGQANQTVDALIATQRIPPMLLVMPDGKANMQVDSEWADGAPPAPQVESYMVREVIPYIDAHYRTLADREHRGIGGLSSGGYGAVNLLLHHPEVFSVALGISGTYSTPKTLFNQPLFKDAASAAYNAPIIQVKQVKDPRQLHVYLAVGEQDQVDNTLTETQAFERALVAAGISHQAQYAPGAHSWNFWGLRLVDGLKYFAAVAPKALSV